MNWGCLRLHDCLLDRHCMDQSELKKLAVEANNEVWGLISRPKLSDEEKFQAISAAYASYYLWDQIGTDLNRARGHWLISRTLCVIECGELALSHAQQCNILTERAADKKDFDLFYASEALARACAASGKKQEAIEYLNKAAKLSELVKDPEDRTICETDLKAEPWFGIR